VTEAVSTLSGLTRKSMSAKPTGSAPIWDRWLILAASRLVPADRRPDWLKYWFGGAVHWWAFLAERGEPRPAAVAKLHEYSKRAAVDAWRERFPGDSFDVTSSRFLRSPIFLLGLILLCLTTFTVATGGLADTRAAFRPLPYSNPKQLFTVTQHFTGFGQLNGVPAATLRMWESCPPENLLAMAAYQQLQVQLGRDTFPDEPVRGMYVSPEFFATLGVHPWLGRGFVRSDYSNSVRMVVLSAEIWRHDFRADMAVIGRTVTLDGQPAVITGVMPPSFWFASRKVALWTLLPRELTSPGTVSNWRSRFIGVVVRLPNGMPPGKAELSLGLVARGNPVPWNGAFPEFRTLDNLGGPAFYICGAALLMTVALILGAAFLPFGPLSLRAMSGLPFSQASHYWWFFFGKTALLMTLLTAVWLEMTQGLSDPVAGFLSSWLFFLVCSFAAIFMLADQRRRCPVCLYRLTLPVSMGTLSRPLLDPASTELLCDRGHGMLTVPDSESSSAALERWTTLDASWRELFTR